MTPHAGPGTKPFVAPVDVATVSDLAELHSLTIPSFNSSLGPGHLTTIYRTAISSDTGIAYAYKSEKLLGFVCGTSDYARLEFELARSLTFRYKCWLIYRVLTSPRHWGEIVTTAVVRRLISRSQRRGAGYLISISVHPEASGLGVGRLLFSAFLTALRQRGVGVFLVDTKAHNLRARAAYEAWGLRPVRRSFGSILYRGETEVVLQRLEASGKSGHK